VRDLKTGSLAALDFEGLSNSVVGCSDQKDRSVTRLGIIGCGRIAEQGHVPAALATDAVEISGIADNNRDRLTDIADRFRLSCAATTCYEDLIGAVDAVVVSLPNDLHYSVASTFLNHRIHVLCEKPLATTLTEATRLCEIAEARRAVLAVGFMKRFEPNFVLVRQLLETNFLGDLYRFEFEYGTTGGWAPHSGYNLQREQAGGGVLMINGSHFLDRMLCWFGCPSDVRYSDDAHGGVEANCCAVFTFSSGLVGEVRLSKTVSLRNRFRLYGQRGCLEVPDSQRESATFFPADHPELKHEIVHDRGGAPLTDADYFRLQIEDFVRAIQRGAPPSVTGRQALPSIDLVEKCYRARTNLSEPWLLETLASRRADGPDEPNRDTRADSGACSDGANVRGGAAGTEQERLGLEDSERSKSHGVVRTSIERVLSRPDTILVTGSTGFVGSRLCEVLHLATGYRVRPFVHSSGAAAYIARYPLDFRMGDLTDFGSIRAAAEGCSTIVHLARGSRSVMIDGLKNALRAAVDAKVQRFVHVSSVAVYGDNPPAAARDEAAPARRTGNDYGDLKLEQEELVAAYGRRFGLPFVILRPPHIFGPYSHFVNALVQRLKTASLPVVDGGASICNLVYIDNFIEAVLLCLEKSAAVGETFFVTDKEQVTWRQCLEAFGAMLGVDVPEATASDLVRHAKPTSRDALRRISTVLMADEFRSAMMDIPVVGAVGGMLRRVYAGLSARRRHYWRSRLQAYASPPVVRPGTRTYDATDYLIVSQARRVAHRSTKAERILGYTGSVQHEEALNLTRAWLRFANVI